MNFINVISLGYFCSVAKDLEKLGLRNFSSPFDWCISDWGAIEMALRCNFDKFLDEDLLFQNKTRREIYKNKIYGVEFFHDFDKYKPLSEQMDSVKNKYSRRCDKFMNKIRESTLFIRYINTEKNLEELRYIENNYEKINALIKTFNPNSEIVFLLDDKIETSLISVYKVKINDDDVVCREPLFNNDNINRLLEDLDFPSRDSNLSIFKKKEQRANLIVIPTIKKIYKTIKSFLLKEYVHFQQY